MTTRGIGICDQVLIVPLTRNLAKTEFFFPKGRMLLCLLYIDVDGTSKFNETDLSSSYVLILNALKQVVKFTEVGSVIENVEILIIAI